MSGAIAWGRSSRRAVVAVAQLIILIILSAAGQAEAAPRLELRPQRLTFAAAGETRLIGLHNAGDAPLQLWALAFSADSAGFSAEQIIPRQLLPGEALTVAVRYERAGARPQAFGALLVYSDDPGGFDDPRSAERDFVRSAALVAGETTATVWLWLPPLAAAALLIAGRARRGGRVLVGAGTLLPLAAGLWLAGHFDPGFAVPQGNYGIQLGLHRALWSAAGLELWSGVDGLSLPLVLLLTMAAGLRLLLPAAGGAGEAAPAWSLLLHGGALLGVCSLDAGWLLCGFELALLGAWGRLGGARWKGGWLRRRTWGMAAQVGVGLLVLAVAALRQHSLPTALVDGTTVAHTTDLVKLGYANYFGDLAVKGVALDRLLWGALVLGALLPVLLLPAVRVPVGERLSLSLPLLVLAVSVVLRLAFYALPQATVALGPWLLAAALAWGLFFTLRALRQKQLGSLLLAAVTARAGGIFIGLLAATQSGAHAALMQLWHHGLAVLLLALAEHSQSAGSRSANRGWSRASQVVAALLILDAPGMLGFVQRTLLVIGVLPELRVAAFGLTAMGLLVPMAALRLALVPPVAERSRPGALPDERAAAPPSRLLVLAGLTAAAVVLGVFPQPLCGLAGGFVSDFVAHVFTHLDASAIAARFP